MVATTGSERVTDLLKTAWDFRVSEQWEEMLALTDEARAISEQIGFEIGIARSLAVRAFVQYIRSDFQKALAACIEALQRSHGDLEAECRARSVLAMVHWSLGNYEEALRNGESAIDLLDRIDDQVTKAFAFSVKGGILLSLGQTEEALAWHQRSVEAFQSLPGEDVGRSRALAGLGLALLAQKQYEKALALLLEALQIAQTSGHRITIARILNDLGEVFEALQDDAQALRYHSDALEIRIRDGYRQAETTSLLALGRISARSGDHARALEVLQRGLGIAEELQIRPRIAQFHQTLAELHQKMEQLAPALQHFLEAQKIRSGLDVDQVALRYKALEFESQLEALQRRAELESLASLGRLVAAITHEVNSPLGALQSSASSTLLAAEKLAERHDARAVEALKINSKVITDATRRISELIARLKILAGIDQAPYAQIDIRQAIEDVLSLLRGELPDSVSVSVEQSVPAVIYGNVTGLHQVFLNLLRNSIQAIDGAGRVVISIDLDEEWLRITFADTGHGIPAGMIPKLFTPDFHSESGRVRASFGLFASMTIVRKHGGDIRVESQPGKGSTFIVLLPRALESIEPGRDSAVAS